MNESNHFPKSQPCPLWAAISFTFLNSLGTGVVTSGVFFLAREAYGFGEIQNFAIAAAFGAFYIVGALGIGPLLRILSSRFHWLSTQTVLAGLMLSLGILCAIPWLADSVGLGGTWPIWLLMIAYGPLSGALWPLIEAYISGGRSGQTLRSATGRFNIAWSSALVVAFWLMAPLVEPSPLLVLLATGVVHIVCLAVLKPLGAEPASHTDQGHDPHPVIYNDLLHVFRALLATSYIVVSALAPFLATVLDRMELAVRWHTPIASVWLLTRLATFITLEKWQGWHGKRSPAYLGSALLILGFTGTLMLPSQLQGDGAVWSLVGSLAVFGIGMGVIYAAAFYYAMEVGQAEVDAGGKHEAMVGLGYTAGPLLMLLAFSMSNSGLMSQPTRDILIIVVLITMNIFSMGFVLHKSRYEPMP